MRKVLLLPYKKARAKIHGNKVYTWVELRVEATVQKDEPYTLYDKEASEFIISLMSHTYALHRFIVEMMSKKIDKYKKEYEKRPSESVKKLIETYEDILNKWKDRFEELKKNITKLEGEAFLKSLETEYYFIKLDLIAALP